MPKTGFIKTWRKELESDIWKMPPLYHRVWHYLLLEVSWEKNIFPTRNLFGIHLNPGQGLFSIQMIIDGVAWRERNVIKKPNKKTILDILKWLEFNRMIGRESNGNGTFISVMKWHRYQPDKDTKVTEGIPQSIPQGIPQSVHTKEVKEVKEEEEERNCSAGTLARQKQKTFNPLSSRPDWISEKDWKDLIDHRKAKKTANTERAYSTIISELEKALQLGFSVSLCVDTITTRDWRGFKAEWMENEKSRQTGHSKEKPMTQNQRYAIELLKEMQ